MPDPHLTLADPAATPDDLLAALAALRRIRRDLDATERGLIERAREEAVAWPRIAEALGVASRQAAEQRLLRLSAAQGRDPGRAREARVRQRIADTGGGQAIQALRAAVTAAGRQVLADPEWDRRHARAALVRASLEEAASAPPGPMFALVGSALEDLGAIPPADLPAAARPAFDTLRSTWDDARATAKG